MAWSDFSNSLKKFTKTVPTVAARKMGDLNNTSQPQYTSPIDFTSYAESFFPNIETLPEYQKATTYQLPAKPTIDQQKYEDAWKLASEDINKAFRGPEGYLETGMEGLANRGLSTSGEANKFQLQLGESLAEQLAKARSGIEIQRSGAEDALNQWYAGLEAQKGAAESSAAERLMGVRNQRQRDVADYASGLSNIQNIQLDKTLDRDTQNKLLQFERDKLNAILQRQDTYKHMDYFSNLFSSMDKDTPEWLKNQIQESYYNAFNIPTGSGSGSNDYITSSGNYLGGTTTDDSGNVVNYGNTSDNPPGLREAGNYPNGTVKTDTTGKRWVSNGWTWLATAK